MPAWKKLYGMIWLNFFTLLLACFDGIPWHAWVHSVLGFAVLVLAVHNQKILAATPCPDRIKRIAAAMVLVSVLGALSGVPLLLPLPTWLVGILKFLHLTAIAALFTQSASVATSHDMWEQKEFEPKA